MRTVQKTSARVESGHTTLERARTTLASGAIDGIRVKRTRGADCACLGHCKLLCSLRWRWDEGKGAPAVAGIFLVLCPHGRCFERPEELPLPVELSALSLVLAAIMQKVVLPGRVDARPNAFIQVHSLSVSGRYRSIDPFRLDLRLSEISTPCSRHDAGSESAGRMSRPVRSACELEVYVLGLETSAGLNLLL